MLLIRDNSKRAREISLIFIFIIAVSVINILSLGWQYMLLLEIEKFPDNIDIAKINVSDTIQGIIGVSMLILSVLSIIYFIRWFRRAYNNVHAIPSSSVLFSEGWAAGSWFVPFLNLVRPFQIMKEIWVGTQQAITHRLGNIQSTSFVGIWWAVYLIMSIYNNFVFRYSLRADSLGELITATELELAGEVISIPAAILTMLLIKKTQVFEKELWDAAQNPGESVFSLIPVETQS